MKLKFIVIIFIIGCIITTIGALFKIQHWPHGSELLTIGTGFQVISGILLIVKLIKNKNMLNS